MSYKNTNFSKITRCDTIKKDVMLNYTNSKLFDGNTGYLVYEKTFCDRCSEQFKCKNMLDCPILNKKA